MYMPAESLINSAEDHRFCLAGRLFATSFLILSAVRGIADLVAMFGKRRDWPISVRRPKPTLEVTVLWGGNQPLSSPSDSDSRKRFPEIGKQMLLIKF